ncbi:GyrI-like domain-containing protein [Nocardia farcinica]|uniref:GyrI-like domain-containing protein n=1 Tax=Nocardia farcinica TaxID=37329 RepID=UPI000C009DFC|nr:GyrI-like domain-containing protein [Nocardia farcinica]MBA4857656.1 DUF302 domain-containing protein [Nocardia farcinica]MBC9817855.1 DUF302 domain-containing protein [Nocardia farcinica]PFX10596.1 hypothetical protein CJ468_00262 [Nocardia farcinica]
MSYQVTVDRAPAQTVLELRRTVHADRPGEDIGNGMRALYAAAAAIGLAPAGAPSTTYRGPIRHGSATEVDFALPVQTSLDDEPGDIVVRRTEPILHARLVHRGPYQSIGDAYRALDVALREGGLTATGPPTEVYLVAPDDAVTPHDLLTEIRVPVAADDLAVRLAMPFDSALAALRSALRAEGFGVVSEVDVRATLREQLGATVRNHVVLGALDPHLAHRALDVEDGPAAPVCCTVVVREEEADTVVSAVDPDRLVGSPALLAIAAQARAGLAAALRRVASPD